MTCTARFAASVFMIASLSGQQELILELMSDMQRRLELNATQATLKEVSLYLQTVKTAISATNTQVKDHESLITRLEPISA